MTRECRCLRCGYQWTPRVEGRPKQCPNCKQPQWDRKSQWVGARKIVKKPRKAA